MLGFFGLLTPLITTASAALNANIGIGSLSVSLGGILAFLIAIWASFLISKFLRFLLEEDVYQYFLLAGGVPHAISTLLHYLILLVGFFIALGALGIDLTKITILAGAFSVGIGFGLQNVINNFVSGLILLFERPIKIGDVIEVGGKLGEVRRIGIRASVIRAADGSEVIVPNGSLISNQVTNWTLSDRGRAVDISVSVAGGSNVARVKELLKSTAAANPDVVKKPAPQVYVVNSDRQRRHLSTSSVDGPARGLGPAAKRPFDCGQRGPGARENCDRLTKKTVLNRGGPTYSKTLKQAPMAIQRKSHAGRERRMLLRSYCRDFLLHGSCVCDDLAQ